MNSYTARGRRLAIAVLLIAAPALVNAAVTQSSTLSKAVAAKVSPSAAATGDYGPVLLQQIPGTVRLTSIGRLRPAADGSFYAPVPMGGMYLVGSVVHLLPDGSVSETYISSPQNGGITGSHFADLAIGSQGQLFVAAQFSVGGTGTLFELSPDGTKVNVLHSFSMMANGTNADGALPVALATDNDGAILGVTASGGPGGGGVLFKLSPGGQYSVLYAFTDTTDPSTAPEGNSPGTVLIGKDHAIYVSTNAGGANGSGAISRLGADGSMHEIHSNTGRSPVEQMVQTGNGSFMGLAGIPPLTHYFALTPAGRYTAISPDPLYGNPNSLSWLLTGPDGLVYGSTYSGGPLRGGCLFRFNADDSFEGLAYLGTQATAVTSVSAAGFGSDGNLYGIGNNDPLGTSSFKLPLPPPAGWGTGTPPTVSLTAAPTTVPLGQSTTITWNSNNADQCELFGEQAPRSYTPSGSRTMTPASPGKSTIAFGCSNKQGLAQQTHVTIDVVPN